MDIASVFAASLLLAAAVSTPVRSQTPSPPQLLADGKRLYDVNCANCHGARAQGAVKAGAEISIIAERGGKQPPDLTDKVWDHGSTDDAIFTAVKKGIPLGMMPPFEGRLSDVQIRNVITYVRSLASPQAESNAASVAATPPAAVPERQSTERAFKLAALMTHNYNYDIALLRQLLNLDMPYIGVLGPKKKLDHMLEELSEKRITVTAQQLNKIYGPVGLDLGAETSEEIALSVLAEIKAVFSRKESGFLRNNNMPIHARQTKILKANIKTDKATCEIN